MGIFNGKTIVVTGAREGVGSTTAISFAAEGGKLILISRNEPKDTIEKINKIGGIKPEYVLCDISVESQVIEMANKVKKITNGCIDVLVNCAGFNGKASLVENMKLEDWQYTLGVNLTGTMLMCREMIPFMNPEKAAIVNVSSNVARRGLPYRADYVCSKWALLGFTQTLALELVDRKIRVNAVCPGPIEGERIMQLLQMHAEAEKKDINEMYEEWKKVPMKRFIKPEEVANVIMFLCSDQSSAMTGQSLNVTGGMLMN